MTGRVFANIDEAAKAIVAAYKASQEPPLPHARDCNAQQLAALRARLTAPAGPAPIVPVHAGRRVKDMSPTERREAYAALGVRL